MLHRSASSSKKRTSRSPTSAPQKRPSRSATASPARKSNTDVTTSPVDPVDFELETRISVNTIIPIISSDSRPECSTTFHYSPSTKQNSAVADIQSTFRSPRNNSLTAEGIVPNKSQRSSLVPDNGRSPRNSLVPDVSKSPRASLVPEVARSTRTSLVPDISRSPRNSLVADRSPRNSLIPDIYGLSSRGLFRSPRSNSLSPDYYVSSHRNSLQLVSESINRLPRPSIMSSEAIQNFDTEDVQSPRGSNAAEGFSSTLRRISPRGSTASEYYYHNSPARTPRRSLDTQVNLTNMASKNPRGSATRSSNLVSDDTSKSPRGSLTLTFQEPPMIERRRSGEPGDFPEQKSRGRGTAFRTSSTKSTAQSSGYSNLNTAEDESRRASSSVSGDEQRRLCSDQNYNDHEQRMGFGLSMTTYGSVAYQLKDANLEASGTCDFVSKALGIVNNTVIATICLMCLSALPIIMLIMGLQFLRDCPREPHIPLYMIVGGIFGSIKISLMLWRQLSFRVADASLGGSSSSLGSRIAYFLLTVFLITWFAVGNYWILRIKWPEYSPTLFEPNRWCHRTLYGFALVHLFIVYSTFGLVIFLVILLAGGHCLGGLIRH